MKEADLQKAIIKHLNRIGILAWRNNTGAFLGEYKGKKRFIRFGIPGAADIFAINKNGIFMGIECKSKGKKPSIAQVVWMNMIDKTGARAYWVDSWESWESICRDMGWPV